MSEAKYIEVRDHATFIPALAVRIDENLNESEDFIRGRAGWPVGTVVLTNLSNMETQANFNEWSNSRTMPAVHEWLENEWDSVESGQVIDVAFLKAESDYIKLSERIDPYNDRKGVPLDELAE